MKISSRQKNFLLFAAILVTAVVVRVVLFNFWLHSPLRYYSELKGLDMQTLLDMGRLFYQGKFSFSLYNLLLATVMFCHGGAISVPAVIVIQQLLGGVTALLVAWITLRITRRRWSAGVAGTVAALYAPALIYEAVTLRETLFVFTAVLGLGVMINLVRHHFSTVWLLIAGSVIVLPFLVRFPGVGWYLTALTTGAVMLVQDERHRACFRWQAVVKKIALLLAGGLLLLSIVAMINYHNRGAVNSISHSYLNYLITTGRQAAPRTVNISAPSVIASEKKSASSDRDFLYGLSYWLNNGKKFLKLFQPYEIPNNINYYFMRSHLFPCSLLFGPGLVLPLAVAGLLLMLLRLPRLTRYEWLLLLYILSFALPPAIFLPLGRYRLVLYPVFAIMTAYACLGLVNSIKELVMAIKRHPAVAVEDSSDKSTVLNWSDVGKPGGILAVIIILPIIFYLMTRPPAQSLRATDFIGYGKALKIAGGGTAELEQCFARAWQLSPTSPAAAINYTDILLQQGKRRAALEAIAPAWRAHPHHSGIALFASSALLCNGRARQAEQVLLKAGKPKTAAGLKLYYYNLAESYRLQGKQQQFLQMRRNLR